LKIFSKINPKNKTYHFKADFSLETWQWLKNQDSSKISIIYFSQKILIPLNALNGSFLEF
jgi:hypothetical protein